MTSEIPIDPWVLLLIIAWTLPWKGVALWRSVKNGQKKWFIALLILNTFAILEIIYIFYFSKKRHQSTNDTRIYE